MGAGGAVAGRRLVSRNQVLTVLPAPLDEQELERRLADTDAAAIMKVGRHLQKVKRVLGRLGLVERAEYVERASMAGEKVMPLAEAPHEGAPYFSMILVRRADEAPGEVEA